MSMLFRELIGEKRGKGTGLPGTPGKTVSMLKSFVLSESVTSLLKSARQARNISLEDAVRATKLSQRVLKTLEGEEFAGLPPAEVYVRSFIKTYAGFLGVAREAMDAYEKAAQPSAPPVESLPPAEVLDLTPLAPVPPPQEMPLSEGPTPSAEAGSSDETFVAPVTFEEEKRGPLFRWEPVLPWVVAGVALVAITGIFFVRSYAPRESKPAMLITAVPTVQAVKPVPAEWKSKLRPVGADANHGGGPVAELTAVDHKEKVVVVPERKKPAAVPLVREQTFPVMPAVAQKKQSSVSPAVQRQGLCLTATAMAQVWVRVKADNDVVFEGTLSKDQQMTWDARREFVIRVGSAGALSLVLNDKNLGKLGAKGQVKTVVIAKDGTVKIR